MSNPTVAPTVKDAVNGSELSVSITASEPDHVRLTAEGANGERVIVCLTAIQVSLLIIALDRNLERLRHRKKENGQ